MKKRFEVLTALTLVFLTWTVDGLAAPVGNAAAPAILTRGIVMGEKDIAIVVGSMVESANNLKYNEPESATGTTTGVGNTEFRFSGLQGGVIYSDWLWVYGFVGQGWMTNRGRIVETSDEYGVPDTEMEIKLESDKDVLVGAGVSAVLYSREFLENRVFRIALDGKTRRIALGTNTALIDGEKVRDIDYFMSIREYQAALAVSWQIDNFIPYTGIMNTIVPYAGVKISKASGFVRFRHGENRFDRRVMPSAEEVGQFIGISFNFNDGMSLNLESRLKDEEALGIHILVRF